MKRRSLVSVYGFFIYKRGQNKMFTEYLISDYLAREDAGVRLFNEEPRPPVQTQAQASAVKRFPKVQTYIEQCTQGLPMPSSFGMRKVWDALGEAEVQVVSGQDARVAAEGAIAKIEGIIEA